MDASSFDAMGLPDGLLDDASSCQSGSAATFSEKTYHAATRFGNVCSREDITAFYGSCIDLSAATEAACSAFFAAKPACAACIQTPDTAETYGPIVASGSLLRANVAGCVELFDPSQRPCAVALQGQAGCEYAACGANCPISGSSSTLVYNDCASMADRTVCTLYVGAASCVGAEEDGGPASLCFSAPFGAFYDAVASRFCGEGASATDAGGAIDADVAIDADANEGAANWDSGPADASAPVGDQAADGGADASRRDGGISDASAE